MVVQQGYFRSVEVQTRRRVSRVPMTWHMLVLPILLVMSYFTYQQNERLETQLEQDKIVYSR